MRKPSNLSFTISHSAHCKFYQIRKSNRWTLAKYTHTAIPLSYFCFYGLLDKKYYYMYWYVLKVKHPSNWNFFKKEHQILSVFHWKSKLLVTVYPSICSLIGFIIFIKICTSQLAHKLEISQWMAPFLIVSSQVKTLKTNMSYW